MKRFTKSLLLLPAMLFIWPSVVTAQEQHSEAFREKYKLKEVVVLSRHNIRSPLSSNNSLVGRCTPYNWIEWSSGTSELTLRGGVLETIMGQYFRKWLINEGLFEENATPDADEVHIYANSMQRTIATAQYFTSGFMPVANLKVMHRMAPSQMDPIFHQPMANVSDDFRRQALEEIAERYGEKELQTVYDSLKEAFRLLSDVLDIEKSPAYKAGEVPTLDKKDLRIPFEKDKEPRILGGLRLATSAADALVLQYYEETDDKKAAFGHRLSQKDWEKIAGIINVYGDLLYASPLVARYEARPLLVYISDELKLSKRKFTFLCGHDSNIANICAALEIEKYDLPNSIEKKTPIGGKLVFEKWTDSEMNEFIAINMVYQSTQQLRSLNLLNLQHPPMIVPLKLRGLQQNEDGLYPAAMVQERFDKAKGWP